MEDSHTGVIVEDVSYLGCKNVQESLYQLSPSILLLG